MSSAVCIFVGVLLGLGVGDGLGAAVGVGVDAITFFLGWWVCGLAKVTPTHTKKDREN
jgi:preprotein translocase subunit SecG